MTQISERWPYYCKIRVAIFSQKRQITAYGNPTDSEMFINYVKILNVYNSQYHELQVQSQPKTLKFDR